MGASVAQHGLVTAVDKQIDRGRFFATFEYQFGFADTSAPCHHRHLRMVPKGCFTGLLKPAQFLYPVVKVHVSPFFHRCNFYGGNFSQR